MTTITETEMRMRDYIADVLGGRMDIKQVPENVRAVVAQHVVDLPLRQANKEAARAGRIAKLAETIAAMSGLHARRTAIAKVPERDREDVKAAVVEIFKRRAGR